MNQPPFSPPDPFATPQKPSNNNRTSSFPQTPSATPFVARPDQFAGLNSGTQSSFPSPSNNPAPSAAFGQFTNSAFTQPTASSFPQAGRPQSFSQGGPLFAHGSGPAFGPVTPFGSFADGYNVPVVPAVLQSREGLQTFGNASVQGAFGTSQAHDTYVASNEPLAFGAQPAFGSTARDPAFNPPLAFIHPVQNTPFATAPPNPPFPSATTHNGMPAGIHRSAFVSQQQNAPFQSHGAGFQEANDPFAPRATFEKGGPAAFGASPAVSKNDPFALPSHPRGMSPGATGDRTQKVLAKQVLIRSVPASLFSEDALLAHFGSILGIVPLSVSLRGSVRGSEGRRSAVVSFEQPHEASIAMSKGKVYKGRILTMSYFRGTAQAGGERVESQRAHLPTVTESNELVFLYVPPALFKEDAVRDLFNSISGNMVVGVSIRSRPNRGTIKRTAIISFRDVASARTAIQNLPLYNGEQLDVNYRRSQHLVGGQRGNDAVENPSMHTPILTYESMGVDSRQRENFDFDENPLGHEGGQLRDKDGSQGEMTKSQDSRQAEMEQLRRTIHQREAELKKRKKYNATKVKERARHTDGVEGNASTLRTENRLTDEQARRRASKMVVRKENNSGNVWRSKVGEKVNILDAVQFVGTCQTMCPAKELEERILQRDISAFETVSGKGSNPDPSKAVKKYRRSAAISEEPQPEEVRPPPVLLRTMDYLKGVCDSQTATFADIHNFVRDRTRSLRQDFTYQGIRDEICIRIHEESVRFHILSEHRLCGTDPAIFSSKQNREQLDKCLISLREMYELRHKKRLPTSPNEPEMQAYYMIMLISESQACAQLLTGFNKDVRKSLHVQFALQVMNSVSVSSCDFVSFFSYVRAAPYLLACLMHSRFYQVRCDALRMINSTHGNSKYTDVLSVQELTHQLGFASEEEAIEFCTTANFRVGDRNGSGRALPLMSLMVPSKADFSKCDLLPQKPHPLIEKKAGIFKCSEIIAGALKNKYDLSVLPCGASHLRKLKVTNVYATPPTAPKIAKLSPGILRILKAHAGPCQKNYEAARPSVLSRIGKPEAKRSAPIEMMKTPREEKNLLKNEISVHDAARQVGVFPVPSEPTALPTGLAGPSTLPSPTLDAQYPHTQITLPTSAHRPKTTVGEVVPSPKKRVTFKSDVYTTPAPPIPDLPAPVPRPSKSAEVDDSSQKNSSEDIQRVQREAETVRRLKAERKLREEDNKRREAEIRHQEAERKRKAVVLAKRLRQEEMLRAKLVCQKEEIDSLTQFGAVSKDIAREISIMRCRLKRVNTIFDLISIENDGREKAVEEIGNAHATFEGVIKELKNCNAKVEASTAVTPWAKKLKLHLKAELRDIRTFGDAVWRKVWMLKGVVIVTPISTAKSRQLTTPTSKSITPKRVITLKRKAHDTADERLKREGSSGSELCSPGDTVGKASKRSKTLRAEAKPEIEAVVGAMHQHGVIRLQVAIVRSPSDYIAATERTDNWILKRFKSHLESSEAPLKYVRESERPAALYLSVQEVKKPPIDAPYSRLPPTANIVIFSFGLSSQLQCSEHCRWIQATLSQREQSVRIETALPVLVLLVYMDQVLEYSDEQAVGPCEEHAFCSALEKSGLISGFHLVRVPKHAARFGYAIRQMSDVLKEAVGQLMSETKRLSLDLRRGAIGEWAVDVGTSAWIKFLSGGKSHVREERSHIGVIDSVNRAWAELIKQMDEEEGRWAEEMSEQINSLRELKVILRRKLRLPLPSEVGAETSAMYISKLAGKAGVARISGFSGLSLPQFCRALGHVMTPYIAYVLDDYYFRMVNLPCSSLQAHCPESIYELGRSMGDLQGKAMNPPDLVERAWNGTPIAKEPVALTGTKQRGYRLWDRLRGDTEPVLHRVCRMWSPQRGIAKPTGRRLSLDILRRKLDFTPMTTKRRNSWPARLEERREAYGVYSELVEVEEAHQRMLDGTIGMLQEQITRASPGVDRSLVERW